MLHPLEPARAANVLPLFHEPHFDLVMRGIIAGNSPARLWVDDPESPHTVFIWDKTSCCYLAGYDESLGTIVRDTLLPAQTFFKVECTSPASDAALETIFAGGKLARFERFFYAFDRLKQPGWRDRLPPGFHIEPITAEMLESGMANVPDLIDEIEQCWNSIGQFLQHGFGFCALHDQAVVCRCTAEYVSGGRCGIGIATAEAYQNRGLATLTASAFVEHCAARGIISHWDCWKNNGPSVTVAENVGFRRVSNYTATLVDMR